MFFVALGLGPASLITSFIQCVVIDTIVVRKYEWVVAFELMLVLFRKIENSTGSKYNLGNVIEEVHLNSALDEAMEAAKIFFPLFFRAGGGKLRENETHPDQDDKKGEKKFNGKFNKNRRRTSMVTARWPTPSWRRRTGDISARDQLPGLAFVLD